MRYICIMKRTVAILILVIALFADVSTVSAQARRHRVRGVSSACWRRDASGDSVLYITFQQVNISHSRRDLRNYERMVRAVKKVYPLALEAAERLDGMSEELAELERRQDRRAYTRAIEDALKAEIGPMIWKMTRYEGSILLKLIDRETDLTAFNIIRDFRSGFTAGFYQALARLFGNNLKLEYDPEGEDAMLEQIVRYYHAGLL